MKPGKGKFFSAWVRKVFFILPAVFSVQKKYTHSPRYALLPLFFLMTQHMKNPQHSVLILIISKD